MEVSRIKNIDHCELALFQPRAAITNPVTPSVHIETPECRLNPFRRFYLLDQGTSAVGNSLSLEHACENGALGKPSSWLVVFGEKRRTFPRTRQCSLET